MNPFYALLEKGVGLQANTGCSLRDFLCGQIGLSDDYLDNRIQTLFLNARPVDDVKTAVIRDGDTLALSAAMPGLVGATMRKGGHYASLRQGISQQADTGDRCQARGRVTLKMFNMVAKEVGGHLLSRGVEVNGSDLERAFRRSVEGAAIASARLDGNPVSPDTALFSSLSAQPIWLTLLPTD
jgi:hypothetical protein